MLGLIIKVLLITTHGLLPSKWAIVSDEMLRVFLQYLFQFLTSKHILWWDIQWIVIL